MVYSRSLDLYLRLLLLGELRVWGRISISLVVTRGKRCAHFLNMVERPSYMLLGLSFLKSRKVQENRALTSLTPNLVIAFKGDTFKNTLSPTLKYISVRLLLG